MRNFIIDRKVYIEILVLSINIKGIYRFKGGLKCEEKY